jgi:MOSC domain-containing protein YiiM
MLSIDSVDPQVVRRNIVISGLNLLALKDKDFFVGGARLSFTGLCHPCSRMEAALGPGGYNALRGHGPSTTDSVKFGAAHTCRCNG